MDKLQKLVYRLDKLGIKVEFSGNYPWVYLDSVNGVRVKERFKANHGFTAMFTPVRVGEDPYFPDLKKLFSKIREIVETGEDSFDLNAWYADYQNYN